MTLPDRVSEAIVGHARRAAPFECCGLLLGDDSTIVDVVPTHNVHATPRHAYTVDPAAHLGAVRTARERGVQVMGAYHSHPGSAARPSPTDREQAFSHFLFVIVGLGGGECEVSGWELDGGNFVRVPLVRTP